MKMPRRLRRFMLTTHIITSVGWIGAALVFLVLALVGLTANDSQLVRAAYLVMEPAAIYVLLPLALLSLTSGVVLSLGTKWGLIRHYWVLIKLVLTLVSTTVLLAYMQTFRALAATAADPEMSLEMVRNPSPLLHAILALLVLLSATVLAIYKPRGLTRYGWRKEHEKE